MTKGGVTTALRQAKPSFWSQRSYFLIPVPGQNQLISG
jgi:hypothetical protein